MRSSRSAANTSGRDPLDPGPTGFAHRGVHGAGTAENSLAAFFAALEACAGIECDVRSSGDGSAVVFHDADLQRMCSLQLDVERTPAALLCDQRLSGSDQYLPALWQVLEVVSGRVPLLLELKTLDGNADQLCRAVVADLDPCDGPVGVMSFDPRVGRWLKTNAPHVRRGLVIRESMPRLRRWGAMFLANPHFIAVECAALGQEWVVHVRRRMPVYGWTIRTAVERTAATPLADALIWEADGRPRS